MAYYYQHLSLIAEWESGYDSYGIANQKYHTRVPVQSFYVMGGYFLDGRDGEQPRHREAAAKLRRSPGQGRPRRDRAHRPVQLPEHRQQHFHRRPRRPHASGPTSSTPSTPASTGTGRSTSRCTWAGSMPDSETRSRMRPSGFRPSATSSGCASRFISEAFQRRRPEEDPEDVSTGSCCNRSTTFAPWLDIPRSQPDSETAPVSLRLGLASLHLLGAQDSEYTCLAQVRISKACSDTARYRKAGVTECGSSWQRCGSR